MKILYERDGTTVPTCSSRSSTYVDMGETAGDRVDAKVHEQVLQYIMTSPLPSGVGKKSLNKRKTTVRLRTALFLPPRLLVHHPPPYPRPPCNRLTKWLMGGTTFSLVQKVAC